MSYGWLTESARHPQKQQEIQLDKSSIDEAKIRLLAEKEKIKQKGMNSNDNSKLNPIKSDPIIECVSLKPTKEMEIYNKLFIKQRLYEKLASNTELTQEEKECKKRALIDFDSKSKHQIASQRNKSAQSVTINPLLTNEYDDLFIFNTKDNDTSNDNSLLMNYLQLKTQREKKRYDRLKRIQKIKNKL